MLKYLLNKNVLRPLLNSLKFEHILRFSGKIAQVSGAAQLKLP
jgi:hypothetical protein